MPNNVDNGRTLAGVIAELRDELKEFVATRVAMFRSEMKDKFSVWKTAAPMIIAGLALVLVAFLLLTGAIVAAIYVALAGNPFAAAIALLVTCVGYALAGGIALIFAWRGLSEGGVLPKRTLRVLEEDETWIRNEAKVQL
jgi:uncharacterized membrane protein YqjE